MGYRSACRARRASLRCVLPVNEVMMHVRIRLLTIMFLLVGVEATAEQTIVFFRHGEKPSAGYGQLTCQGLNRALALPDVLLAKFGRPAYLYAPNPTVQVPDNGILYYYVRPLATI